MTPIHELLSRIRWDKEFGRGQFEIGYYDRLEDAVHRVTLQGVTYRSVPSLPMANELGLEHASISA
jgi:hypothetical protein